MAKRRAQTRKTRRMLILTEDSKSGYYYIDSLPYADSIKLKVMPNSCDPSSMYSEAKRMLERSKVEGREYIRVFCVFDCDDHVHYERTCAKIANESNQIKAIWSNSCFELWFLLHFVEQRAPIERHEIPQLLATYLGKPYKKSDNTLYETLKDKMQTAIDHSERLLYSAIQENGDSPWLHNPATNMHDLINALK